MHDRPILHVSLLGGFRVAVDDRPVPAGAWRQKRAAAVVKLLAVEPTHGLHREQVLEALWPDFDAETAGRNLRVALHHARAYLTEAGAAPGTFLARDGESLLLGPDESVRVDVDAFERAALRAWRAADPEASESALELYSGELLPGDPYDEWVERRRAGLRATYLALLARLARLADQRGDVDRAIAAQHRIIAVEPAQEEAHVALMRLFALAGRRSQALDQYRQLVTVLDLDVGTAPQPPTLALYEAIRDHHFPEQDSPRVPANVARRTSLPAPVDALIGRERERAEIRQLLASARLVTLTGPGGVGKTRLALAVADDLVAAFPDGACFVDLAPIHDPALVARAIAQVLGLPDGGSGPQIKTLAAALRDMRMMLLLDNFEQVVEAAPLVVNLLRACPGLKVLVTSRLRLRVSGEREYTVPPLRMPEHDELASMEEVAQSEGVRLFFERARAVQLGFAITAENASAVTAICRRLDGLPLAIELAAARVKSLPPESLLTRLETRLPLLTGGGRDLPERQRTMRDTIAWSYDLLSLEEQASFRRLAVFVGGCTLDAIEVAKVTETRHRGEVVDRIASLVDRSLLQRKPGTGSESRYVMLETVREYGLERLAASGEEAAVRASHARYFLALVERTAPRLRGPEARVGLAELEVEHGNLRTALMWFEQTGDGKALLQLAAGLSTYWSENGHWTEGNLWLERALAADPEPSVSRLEALANLGENAGYQGDAARAEAALREGLTLARQLDATSHLAFMLQSLGGQRVDQGAYEAGEVILAEALAEAQRAGDREVEALSLAHLGAAAWGRGDPAEAVLRLQTAQSLGRASGHPVPAEVAARYLGLVAAESGDHAGAAGWYREIVDNDPERLQAPVRLVLDVASLAMACGEAEKSARLFGAAAALAEAIGFAPSWPERGAHERAGSGAREELGGAFDAAFAAASRLTQEQVLAEVIAVLDAAESARLVT